MIIVGIDPGLSGGIAWVGDKVGAASMPVIDGRPDLRAIRELLRGLSPDLVVLEKPSTRPGEALAGTLNMGVNWGLLAGLLLACNWPLEEVASATWKAKMGLSHRGAKATPKEKKEASVALAMRLFPSVELVPEGCRKPSDGMAEALLIAEYGKRFAL